MPSPKLRVAGLLVVIGITLSALNLWFAACRSTIPLAINSTVRGKEVRGEKHPGKDDVYLLELADGRSIQVDKDVYEVVEEQSQMRKEAWHRELGSGQRAIILAWSIDVIGLTKAMPLVVLVLVATAFAAARSTEHESRVTADPRHQD